jgi:hypothetical protein
VSEQEASIHRILEHRREPVHMRQDGKLLCHYSQNFGESGCKEIFDTLNDVLAHLKSTHVDEKGTMDCPISGDCVINCRTHLSLRQHVEQHHRVNAHKCPHCHTILRSRGSLQHHIKVEHDETDHRHPCPEQGCDSKYNNPQDLRHHVDSAHKKIKHKCPECSETFTAKRGVDAHVKRAHRGERFPCPFPSCDVSCVTRSSISRHIKRKHKGELLQCQKEGCTEGFPTLAALKKHTETGHSNKFSCPDDGCTKLFKTQAEADQHWDSDHNGQAFDCGICGLVLSTLQARRRHELQHTHPFVCPRPGCFRRFETFGESLQHGLAEEDHDYLLTPLFRCQIPKCRVAMTARPMAKHELNKHWRAHIANGQVEPETDLIPIPAEPWKFRTLPLFEKILEHNASLAAGDVSSVQNMEESEHVGEDGKDGHTDEDPSLQFEDTDADNIIEDRGDLFSERHRGILLEQNEAYWGM